jgi:sugar phosphate isomerase/epimerase
MVDRRIAVQTLCFKQPFKKALHIAGQMRADGVQIDARNELPPADLSDTAIRQVRRIMNDLNLRVATIRFPNRHGFTHAPNLERRIDAAFAAMQLASQLSARVLVCSLGEGHQLTDPPPPQLLEVLTLLANRGNRLGVQIALQASESPPDALASLLAPSSEAGLGLDLSPADLLLQGADLTDYVSQVGRRIIHVHANDAVRNLGGAPGAAVELGRGSVDIPLLMGMLEEHDYRGWFTVDPRNSNQPIEAAANAVAFLRAL